MFKSLYASAYARQDQRFSQGVKQSQARAKEQTTGGAKEFLVSIFIFNLPDYPA
jgi:hypothetical protein